MKLTPLAVIAFVLAAACSGNKDNGANQPPPTTTDTSAGSMSNPSTSPSSTPAPAATPAMPDTTSHMAPDTSMKKSMKHHKKAGADTTMH